MGSATQVSATVPIDVEKWSATLRQAAKEVFSVMVGLPASDPESGETPVKSDFTGMVGMAGALQGILSIRCSTKTASRIAAQMLGIDITQTEGQQSDAIGEMCNMVAGNFKALVPGLEDKCMLSVPTVITGSEYEVYSLAVGKRIELALMFESEPVWISLEIQG